jgi:hypothetical protein
MVLHINWTWTAHFPEEIKDYLVLNENIYYLKFYSVLTLKEENHRVLNRIV